MTDEVEYDIRAAIRQLPYKVQQAVYRTRAKMGNMIFCSVQPKEVKVEDPVFPYSYPKWPEKGQGMTMVKYGSCRRGKNKQDRRDVRCQLFSSN